MREASNLMLPVICTALHPLNYAAMNTAFIAAIFISLDNKCTQTNAFAFPKRLKSTQIKTLSAL